MTTYDSAYLLALFNRLSGRPSTDAITTTTKYQRLTDAQNAVIADIAAICPNVLYPTVANSALPVMTTTDQQVFTFGTDANGDPIAPIGKVAIYRSLNDIPDWPMRPGQDFLPMGGTAIRIPNNQTYTGTLYWLGITTPPDISATSQPSLFPEASRMLIAIRAVHDFAEEGNRDAALAAVMAARYGQPLLPGLKGQFAQWATTWRTSYRGGGALNTVSGLHLALGSQYNS